MKRNLLPILACPDCREPLEIGPVDEGDDDDITTGTLECRECGTSFPIKEGIPHLLPRDLRDNRSDSG